MRIVPPLRGVSCAVATPAPAITATAARLKSLRIGHPLLNSVVGAHSIPSERYVQEECRNDSPAELPFGRDRRSRCRRRSRLESLVRRGPCARRACLSRRAGRAALYYLENARRVGSGPKTRAGGKSLCRGLRA